MYLCVCRGNVYICRGNAYMNSMCLNVTIYNWNGLCLCVYTCTLIQQEDLMQKMRRQQIELASLFVCLLGATSHRLVTRGAVWSSRNWLSLAVDFFPPPLSTLYSLHNRWLRCSYILSCFTSILPKLLEQDSLQQLFSAFYLWSSPDEQRYVCPPSASNVS